MKSPRIYALVIVVLIGIAALLTRSAAMPAAAPAPARIAVCDIVDLFNNYQRAKDLTAQLNDRRQEIKAEMEKRDKAIEALRLELENYKKGSDKYKETAHQIQWQGLQNQSWLNYQDALALEGHRDLTKEMYTEIKAMIAVVAKQRGVTVVLQREPESIKTDNTAEMLRQIYGRKVLYSADNLDITETVLLSLNQAYKSRKPATVAPKNG